MQGCVDELTMFDPPDWIRLARYISEECSAEEEAATRKWLAADVDRAMLAAHLQSIWDRLGNLGEPGADFSCTPGDAEASWRRLDARLDGGSAGGSLGDAPGDGTKLD